MSSATGIASKQDYFETLKINTIWISGDFVSKDNIESPAENLGTLEDFTQMTEKFKKKGRLW